MIFKEIMVTRQLIDEFAMERLLFTVIVSLMGPFDSSMTVSVTRVMLVVTSFHMSLFIDEAPWTLCIFMLLVVCAIEYFLLMLFGFFFLNIIQLLVIMSLIEVDKVAVLRMMLISDTVVNRFLVRYLSWSELRCGFYRLPSISIMEDFLSNIFRSLLERRPLQGLVMLLVR